MLNRVWPMYTSDIENRRHRSLSEHRHRQVADVDVYVVKKIELADPATGVGGAASAARRRRLIVIYLSSYLSFGQGSSLLWTHTLRPFIAGPLR